MTEDFENEVLTGLAGLAVGVCEGLMLHRDRAYRAELIRGEVGLLIQANPFGFRFVDLEPVGEIVTGEQLTEYLGDRLVGEVEDFLRDDDPGV